MMSAALATKERLEREHQATQRRVDEIAEFLTATYMAMEPVLIDRIAEDVRTASAADDQNRLAELIDELLSVVLHGETMSRARAADLIRTAVTARAE